ncbi:protein kinase [Trypanosoma grayi]|uniref:protein kinase n=1 Tax=Trypanosoma grayi TaxID=71804 RepID=UPI0004F43BA0|nr:protein kinase [Trypanosoma grayi]KEG07260.1 protein kinase [Trypanosoma grayi]
MGKETNGDDFAENEDGFGAGRCVRLLEPTPPPAGGLEDLPVGGDSTQNHEDEPRLLQQEQEQQQAGSEGRGTPIVPGEFTGRRRLSLRPASATTTTTTSGGAASGTGGVRRTLSLLRRNPAPASAEAQHQLQQEEPTLGMNEKGSGAQTDPASPAELPRTSGATTGVEDQRSDEKEQRKQRPLAPLVAAPIGAVGEESSLAPARRQRNSTEWGELMSPTPTPHSMYSCGCTPSVRRHSKTNVPLPSGPTPLDFSSVTEYVETKYEVGEKISEGTYGEVYIGRCRATGEAVALKRLKVLQGLDGFPITSLREVIALQHINKARERITAGAPAAVQSGSGKTMDPIEEVIGLRDVLLSRSHHDIYLVFPYVSCSVAGLLQRRFPFTEREIAYVFKKLLTALKKLHTMGIIHRDVKADNVLIRNDGQVQLCDFGLCVFEGSGRRALTPSLINLSYRPPEMLLGITSYDVKVDIWSIGCFLAQMYLRVPPFFLANRQAAAAAASKADPRHHRRAETELEQLSLITEVLGPLSTVDPDAFPADRCQHHAQLQQLRGVLSSTAASSRSSFKPSLGSLFQPSFLYTEFKGFPAWFVATVRHRRYDTPQLLPSQECVDVLNAIFQLDPRKRPTAAELLEMPFFDLHRTAPRRPAPRGDAGTPRPSEDELIEAHIRREIAAKMQRYHDSHIAPAAARDNK